MRVGIDTGGTFTDVVADDGSIRKVLSTPDDPGRAVRAAWPAGAALVHGTTVATNALLERRGARVALLTTAGFADIIEIARQVRPSLYDPFADRPTPLVPREWRFPVDERVAANGEVLVPLGDVPELPPDIEAVAVCLLHADRFPAHERAVAERMPPTVDVSASHEVAPEFREYERMVTTVINAYLGPVCRRYLRGLGACDVLTSAGGAVPVADAMARPAALLLSGPAGGVLAGAEAAVAAGYPNAVTFDMGGTSTDVCLVTDGAAAPAAERQVGGFPVRLPALDVHTIGAGGGSLARIDAGGALVVGPESAGATPGPACYGRGGTQPTVTDADLVAGRLAPTALPGIGQLSVELARRAMGEIEAEGVIAVVDAAMVEAVRAITVRRGIDPSELALVAFGGAGPVHACAVAEALGMRAVVVPPRAGVLSAVGLLAAPRQADLVRSWPTPHDHHGVDRALAELADDARARVGSPHAEVRLRVDCRYEGQGHELSVPAVADFEAEHERVNGYRRPSTPIEVIALRATALVSSAGAPPAAVERQPVIGPASVAEPDCTLWVPAGWRADVHPSGAWIVGRT